MSHAKSLLLVTLLFTSGCDSGTPSGSDTSPQPAQNTLPSDEIILGKVYAPNVSVPDGFFIDASSQLTGSYTLGHLRSTDLDPLATTSFELCSDTLTQALTWSDMTSRTRGGSMLTASESDRYFEVTRQIDGLADWVALERVFRCDYVDRAGVDLTNAYGVGGQLKISPIAAGDVQELAEYLWQFSSFNNPGHAVLRSQGGAVGQLRRHTLTVAARLPLGGQAPDCDRIEVFDWHFDVNENGNITTSRDAVLSFDARWDGVQAQRCAP